MALFKTIMLFDAFVDFPGARHSLGERDEIPFSDGNAVPFFRGDGHFPIEKVAGFFGIVGPGKLGDLFSPEGPFKNPGLSERLLIRFAFDFDFLHDRFR